MGSVKLLVRFPMAWMLSIEIFAEMFDVKRRPEVLRLRCRLLLSTNLLFPPKEDAELTTCGHHLRRNKVSFCNLEPILEVMGAVVQDFLQHFDYDHGVVVPFTRTS